MHIPINSLSDLILSHKQRLNYYRIKYNCFKRHIILTKKDFLTIRTWRNYTGLVVNENKIESLLKNGQSPLPIVVDRYATNHAKENNTTKPFVGKRYQQEISKVDLNEISTDLTAILKQIQKAFPNHNVGKLSLLHSEANGVDQDPHYDYCFSPGLYRNLEFENTLMSYSCIIALQNNTQLHFYDCESTKKYDAIIMEKGDILIFAANQLHAGAKYDIPNTRLFFFPLLKLSVTIQKCYRLCNITLARC